jgi:membrane associated rhomboid family serine protease
VRSPGFPQRRLGGFGGLGDGAPPPVDLGLLLGVLFVTFSLQFFETTRGVLELLALSPAVLRGALWQLVTYPFVATPGSGFWFLLELLILYWFGRSVLSSLGRRRFWRLLLTSAGVAAVAAVAVEWIVLTIAPASLHLPFVAMLGQRIVLTVVIAAFATLHGEATILLLFVLPVRARWFLWLEILFAFVFFFLPYKDAAGLVGVCVAVFLTYASLMPGGPRRVLRSWRRRLEERILRARLDRMRRRRSFDVIDGGGDDRYIH